MPQRHKLRNDGRIVACIVKASNPFRAAQYAEQRGLICIHPVDALNGGDLWVVRVVRNDAACIRWITEHMPGVDLAYGSLMWFSE